MKYVIQTLLIALIPFMLQAQVIDESDLDNLRQGNYTLEKGKVQVNFSDTVSSDFITKEFEKLGYEIVSSNFQSIMLRVTKIPDAVSRKDLEDNRWVEFIMSESVGMDDEDLEEMNKKDSVDSNRMNEMLKQFNQKGNYEYVMMGLSYKATTDALSEIQAIHPELEFEVAKESERSAIIKTEEGKEVDMMDELDKLPYVLNTAMVGTLD